MIVGLERRKGQWKKKKKGRGCNIDNSNSATFLSWIGDNIMASQSVIVSWQHHYLVIHIVISSFNSVPFLHVEHTNRPQNSKLDYNNVEISLPLLILLCVGIKRKHDVKVGVRLWGCLQVIHAIGADVLS